MSRNRNPHPSSCATPAFVAGHPRLRARMAHLAVLASALCIAGCGPNYVIMEAPGLNHHTRLDRAALEPAQRPDAIDADALLDGTYRTARDQIISESYPASMEELAASLPQSDCMWLGHNGGASEALRLHWELRIFLPPHEFEHISDEVRHLGACRLNDAITRQPVRSKPGAHDFYENVLLANDTEPGIGDGELGIDNIPRNVDDLEFRWGRMREFATDGGSLNACSVEPADDPAAVAVSPESVGYDGWVYEEGRISACSGPFGRIVFPSRDARYEFWLSAEESNVEDAGSAGAWSHRFSPAVKIADPGETFARETQVLGTSRRWATPKTGASVEDVHWQENFSRRIHTAAVRLVTLQGDQRIGLDLAGQRLCIADPVLGPGCRWRCAASASPATGSVFVLRADGDGGPGCRLGESLTGPPDLPVVTPTYVKERLCDRNDAQCQPILEPLAWIVDDVGAVTDPVYIEFTLDAVFEGMALTVAPTQASLGPVQVGRKVQSAFEIRNIGGVPIEIDAVYMVADPQSDADFSARVLANPRPFPLPIRVDATGIEVEATMADNPMFTRRTGERHAYIARNALDGELLDFNGHPVWVEGSVLIRDTLDAQLADPALYAGDYPVHAVSYTLRVVPFTLAPDQRAEVLVSATPRSYIGINGFNRHIGRLHVEAANVFDPTERITSKVPVVVTALNGPSLNVFPPALSLPLKRTEGPGFYTAGTILANFGDVDLRVRQLRFIGAGAAWFSLAQPPQLPLNLAAGASHLLEVQYQPNCDPRAALGHLAWLEIVTDEEIMRVRLSGAPDCNLALP